MKAISVSALMLSALMTVGPAAAANPPSPCPPGFTAVIGYPVSEPDRNGNSVVCARYRMTGQGLILVVIDDVRRGAPTG